MITLIKRQTRSSLIKAIFIGSFSYSISVHATPELSDAYIGLQANNQLKSDFFQVLVAADNENTPYLNIKTTLKQLQTEIECTNNSCKLVLQPDNQVFTINADKKIYTIKGKEHPLPKGVLVKKDNALWLKYSFWQTWLPIHMSWSLENYKVVMQPQFQQLDELKSKHKQSIEEAQRVNKKREKLAAATAQWPTPAWNMELSPRLSLTQTTDGEFTASPSIYTNIDLFKGTLSGSLSTTYNNTSQWDNPDYSWYYQRQDPQGNNLFELGDIYIDNTLLISGYSLENGFSYQRYPSVNQQTKGNFSYHGVTQPNTEIDVWRNGFLRKIVYSDSSGRYLIQDSGSKSGDVYTLVFFFKNGSKIEKKFLLQVTILV
ncbi:hypothetical protein [Piscirickettsia litoralis]|uniref:Uncharacterized protein n=1 Tax=Piscirickettsia litoralis TaxID=1891921 RepID=A0ABX3A076_9GAMM|nr:hypothetical protein [Piscirickettsia litoralis]ODN41883.1 hypothetical protein BGC07_01515 [Piscirickettsia litoralis]